MSTRNCITDFVNFRLVAGMSFCRGWADSDLIESELRAQLRLLVLRSPIADINFLRLAHWTDLWCTHWLGHSVTAQVPQYCHRH